ncbi:hypothetical protein BDR22DRAFT_621007 [Usnea florida]
MRIHDRQVNESHEKTTFIHDDSLGPSCEIFLSTKDAKRTTSPLSIQSASQTPYFYTHLQYSILPISKSHFTHPFPSKKTCSATAICSPTLAFFQIPRQTGYPNRVSRYQSHYLYDNHSSRTHQYTTNSKTRSKIFRSKHSSPSSVGTSLSW